MRDKRGPPPRDPPITCASLSHTSLLRASPCARKQVRAWRGPGGGGGRPAGVREAPPLGRYLRAADVNRSLRGRAGALYWYKDDRWYNVTFGE